MNVNELREKIENKTARLAVIELTYKVVGVSA